MRIAEGGESRRLSARQNADCWRPPDTPSVDDFSVSRQVSWLAGRCGFFVFPAKASDVMAKQLAADSCGGSAGFPHRVRFTDFPLSH